MIKELITHLATAIFSAIAGGFAVKAYYHSRTAKQSGDNVASENGIIANGGSNISNCGNTVNNIVSTQNAANEIELSKQANEILVQFLISGESAFYYLSVSTNERDMKQISHRKGAILIKDMATIDEDLDDIVKAEYLKVEDSPKGTTKIYKWTSKGRKYTTELTHHNT
ncbi:MAG: hypothetical protein IKR81_13035 [Victivallales bacterium]|nr:hypothetical protein [Victivallales bacterium]